MSESCTAAVRPSRQNRGEKNPPRGIFYPAIHVTVARAIWPDKTREHWAAAAGRKPDAAKPWMRGDVSEGAKLALIRILS